MKRNHWVRQGVVFTPGGGLPQPPSVNPPIRRERPWPDQCARVLSCASCAATPLLRSHTPPAGGLSRNLAHTGELQQKKRLQKERLIAKLSNTTLRRNISFESSAKNESRPAKSARVSNLPACCALGPPASAAQYSCRREPCTGR
jgi:hypothetical protein